MINLLNDCITESELKEYEMMADARYKKEYENALKNFKKQKQ